MLRSRSLKQSGYWSHFSDDLPLSNVVEKPTASKHQCSSVPRGHPYSSPRNSWLSRPRLLFAAVLLLVLCLTSLSVSFRHTVCSTLGCIVLSKPNKAGDTLVTSDNPPPIRQPRKKDKSKLSARPTVGRQQLLELGQDEPEHDFLSPERDIVNLRWPSKVTAIPEIVPSPEALKSGIVSSAVDAQFCNGRPCRFLFPLWIGEQESRGRMHLMQVVHLAAALNRTLVLPNVGKSRIGGCGKWPFDAYYDVPSFARQVQDTLGVYQKMVPMDDFKTWLDMRPDSPTAHMIFLDENTTAIVRDPLESTLISREEFIDVYADTMPLDLEDTRLKNARCLQRKFQRLDLDTRYPVSVRLATGDPPSTVTPGTQLAAILQREDVSQASFRHTSRSAPSLQEVLTSETAPTVDALPNEAEVLLIHWDLRHFPFPTTATSQSLNYSSNIHRLAEKLTAMHQPYIAVHWRMETVVPTLLPDCAEALVDTLSILLADPTLGAGVRSIWLATDLPWPSSPSDPMHVKTPVQRSNTFRNVTDEHIEALEILKTAFEPEGALEGWKLTGLAQEIARVRATMESSGDEFALDDDDEGGLLWEDSGVWGILDKMAAMESALFVSAARGCGRVR